MSLSAIGPLYMLGYEQIQVESKTVQTFRCRPILYNLYYIGYTS